MSAEETAAVVAAAVAETGAKGPADMGKLMAVLKPRLAGKADMAEVSKLVKACNLPAKLDPEMIPDSFIQDLLARVDIVDLVDGYVPLKKAGANYAACCPFHNEKSPSFTVSPTKQFYHCFGCGAHGTAISFVMEYQGWASSMRQGTGQPRRHAGAGKRRTRLQR
jgi:hypothetical protein